MLTILHKLRFLLLQLRFHNVLMVLLVPNTWHAIEDVIPSSLQIRKAYNISLLTSFSFFHDLKKREQSVSH